MILHTLIERRAALRCADEAIGGPKLTRRRSALERGEFRLVVRWWPEPAENEKRELSGWPDTGRPVGRTPSGRPDTRAAGIRQLQLACALLWAVGHAHTTTT